MSASFIIYIQNYNLVHSFSPEPPLSPLLLSSSPAPILIGSVPYYYFLIVLLCSPLAYALQILVLELLCKGKVRIRECRNTAGENRPKNKRSSSRVSKDRHKIMFTVGKNQHRAWRNGVQMYFSYVSGGLRQVRTEALWTQGTYKPQVPRPQVSLGHEQRFYQITFFQLRNVHLYSYQCWLGNFWIHDRSIPGPQRGLDLAWSVIW